MTGLTEAPAWRELPLPRRAPGELLSMGSLLTRILAPGGWAEFSRLGDTRAAFRVRSPGRSLRGEVDLTGPRPQFRWTRDRDPSPLPGLPLDEYLAPDLRALPKDMPDRLAESLLDAYQPTALERPEPVDARGLAALMGLEIRQAPVPGTGNARAALTLGDPPRVTRDPRPHATGLMVREGRVWLNPAVTGAGERESAVTRECVHRRYDWMFLKLQLLTGDRLPPDAAPVRRVERTARQVCARVRIPTRTAAPLLPLLRRMQPEQAVRLTAELYGTSREMARLRLTDLGYRECRWVMNWLDGGYLPPLRPSRETWDTYRIGREELAELLRRNAGLRQLLAGGTVVYREGVLCRRDPRWVGPRGRLTAEARRQAERCCVPFRVLPGGHRGTWPGILDARGRPRKEPRLEGWLEQVPEAVRVRGADTAELVRRMQARDNAGEMLTLLMEERGVTVEALCQQIHMSTRTLEKLLKGGDSRTDPRQIVRVCYGLQVPWCLCQPLLYRMHLENCGPERHWAWCFVLDEMKGCPAEGVDEFLRCAIGEKLFSR